ncbi:hypothetical protein HS99_0018410 [Kitasatospora aureofaciens]|uniref:Uncharacterized protein n=1 Tax=Kitasatospora aureofaciens TaxID=1894 RepID=A0A1E7NEK0_KITAU|nr:hypothetical protein [Kitasatospora aureofaciens]ARF83304.1 hypothetical protein B6264_30700 [Kitasatospora aureofaciens]OEV39068.1 hypothetical protein HS99_0018410 [Kitasatospora aureofaciens]
MPSVLGVLERRERVALARAEELRAELEGLQAAVAEADEAARRAVIAREETVAALGELADEAAVPGAPVGAPVVEPVAGVVGPRVEVPFWSEGLGIDALPPDCARIVALVERDAAGGGDGVRARAMREDLGWPASDAREQAARFRAKRLAERGWLSEGRPGLFRPRAA